MTKRYAAVQAVSHYYDFGMNAWKVPKELEIVDRWIDQHEEWIHGLLVDLATEEKLQIVQMNSGNAFDANNNRMTPSDQTQPEDPASTP